jgi:hypothetical protein
MRWCELCTNMIMRLSELCKNVAMRLSELHEHESATIWTLYGYENEAIWILHKQVNEAVGTLHDHDRDALICLRTGESDGLDAARRWRMPWTVNGHDKKLSWKLHEYDWQCLSLYASLEPSWMVKTWIRGGDEMRRCLSCEVCSREVVLTISAAPEADYDYCPPNCVTIWVSILQPSPIRFEGNVVKTVNYSLELWLSKCVFDFWTEPSYLLN